MESDITNIPKWHFTFHHWATQQIFIKFNLMKQIISNYYYINIRRNNLSFFYKKLLYWKLTLEKHNAKQNK